MTGLPAGEILGAMAERMNRLPEVAWDRCTLSENFTVAFGWIEREDEHEDFVTLEFTWGETEDLAGTAITWFNARVGTSSARYSREFDRRLRGTDEGHLDCKRIEDVFGALVDRKVVLAA